MNNLLHLCEDKERFDGCQVGTHVESVAGSREAEWEMIYNPADSLLVHGIVWHQLGLYKKCHSNQLLAPHRKLCLFVCLFVEAIQIWCGPRNFFTFFNMTR